MSASLNHPKISGTELHFAPMQGYTDMAYYNAFANCFNSVDFYYTPYYSADDDLTARVKDVSPSISDKLIAQVLPKDIEELRLLLAFVQRNGFSAINLNLGCPYPMVTRRGRGASLISQGKLVTEMISFLHDHSSLSVSIKTRLGLTENDEVFNLLDAVAGCDVQSVIVHPRVAKQLYKGDVQLEQYAKCREKFPHIHFIYNGDITSFSVFQQMEDLLTGQQGWMLGRGLLSNPFLAGQIKGMSYGKDNEQQLLLLKFVHRLVEETVRDSKNRGHALNRIKCQFLYLSKVFVDSKRIERVVKKAKTIEEVVTAVELIGRDS